MNYPRIALKRGKENVLRRGHPWLFSGAVASVEGNPEPGDVVTAFSHEGTPLALGFFNSLTDIVFRTLTGDPSAVIDTKFWAGRIRAALELRRRVVPSNTDACRLINAEGDQMPGLIVDRYGSSLVISIDTAGMEKRRSLMIEILQGALSPSCIYERSDSRARRREGLPPRIGRAWGEGCPNRVEIVENGLRFEVDLKAGQKTGFFLDQRSNRELLGALCRGAVVLNCFSYTGAFSVYCIHGGAARTVSVETSAAANEIAGRNLALNGISLPDHPIVQADVFAYLRETRECFDLVILDPPPFAKAAKDVAGAVRGYREINLQAVKHLRDGGILATFSCSNPIDGALFEKTVLDALKDAGRTAQLLAVLGPGPDHPVNLAHPEGRYLKGLLLCLASR
ncbi:MAG: class I SAM-dependent rRNA methyltransferase [Deltaproteobacteria bacterium]|nr:class I SAM-dependent rRNA methyltransferase [Deltaproteobacteria bacterium]